MIRLSALTLLFILVASQIGGPNPRAQATGVIRGTVSGPSGPLSGVTVNIVNASGTVVGSTVTTAAGSYSVGNLAIGTYTIQIVSTTGAVVATSTGTISAAAVAATV